jgi:hypothetical protein
LAVVTVQVLKKFFVRPIGFQEVGLQGLKHNGVLFVQGDDGLFMADGGLERGLKGLGHAIPANQGFCDLPLGCGAAELTRLRLALQTP